MTPFSRIREIAEQRKGGPNALQTLLNHVPTRPHFTSKPTHRFLAMMTLGVFQAGFVWKVVEKKWPDFERAFLGFDIPDLLALSDDDIDAICLDKGIIRNVPKIRTVFDNARFIKQTEHSHGKSFSEILFDWPVSDLVGLYGFLKEKGHRLGGMTGQYFVRRTGKDAFLLSRDVLRSLRDQGLKLSENPLSTLSKRDLHAIQDHFNAIHTDTQLPYTHISQIMGFASGDNVDASVIRRERDRFFNGF